MELVGYYEKYPLYRKMKLKKAVNDSVVAQYGVVSFQPFLSVFSIFYAIKQSESELARDNEHLVIFRAIS